MEIVVLYCGNILHVALDEHWPVTRYGQTTLFYNSSAKKRTPAGGQASRRSINRLWQPAARPIRTLAWRLFSSLCAIFFLLSAIISCDHSIVRWFWRIHFCICACRLAGDCNGVMDFLPLHGPTFRPLLDEGAEFAVNSATMGLQVLRTLTSNGLYHPAPGC